MTGPLPGDFAVVAYRRPGVFARLIAWATRSRWTHAFTYLGDGAIAEADPDGYRLGRLADYADTADLLWSTGAVALAAEQRAAIVGEARALLGVPYSWVDIVALALASRGWTAPALLRRLHSHLHLICSQAVVHEYTATGVDLFPGREHARVTPADLAHLIDPNSK